MKRLFSALLALVMVFSALPAMAAAETAPTQETVILEEILPEEIQAVEEALPEETQAVEETTQPETEPQEETAAQETVAQETEPEEIPAEEETTAQMDTVPSVEAAEDTGAVSLTEDSEWDSVSREPVENADSSLPQLGTPTDLEWGFNHNQWTWNPETQTGETTTVRAPGYASWKPAEPDQGQARFEVYREGESYPCFETNWHFSSMESEEWHSVGSFLLTDPETGNYYFTVTSTGDGMDYRDSETAVSETWSYVKPNAKVGTPAAPEWDWPRAFCSTPMDMTNVGEFMVAFYYAPDEHTEPWQIGYVFGIAYPDANIPDRYIQQNGKGYYYARARAISSDITVACNGDWSELSAPYNLTDVNSGVNSTLDNILNNAQTKEEVMYAVQSMDTTALEAAMLADQNNEGAAARIAALESKANVAAGIEVTEDASAFDANQVSVIGAGLNGSPDSEEPVKLVIDKPEKENVIPEAYDNSVAVSFSMDLENVADTENLAVPVKITLPVPASINPNFLVILHYHAYGWVEEIWPYIYEVNGQYYADFVLTSFSDFAMTEVVVKGELTGDGDITEADAEYLLWHTLFPDLYPVDEEEADIDENGTITDDDALLLLWNALFPPYRPQ